MKVDAIYKVRYSPYIIGRFLISIFFILVGIIPFGIKWNIRFGTRYIKENPAAMYKLPRFQSFQNEAEEETQDADSDWHQHITLPLQPEVYAAYKNQQNKTGAGKKDAGQATKEDDAVLSNEHILSAIGDLIRAIDIDGREVIDYILQNNLVKGEKKDDPFWH